jgi:hypothetical protein
MKIKKHDRIKHIFKYMEYDALTDAQHNLVIKYEEFYLRNKYLTEPQYDTLEDIFKQAAENI